MKKYFLLLILLKGFIVINLFSQNITLSGKIKNFENQKFYIYKCQTDTLLLLDSVVTTSDGSFKYFSKPNTKILIGKGLYKIYVNENYFFIINDEKPIVIETEYKFDFFANSVTDKMKIIMSEENKNFFKFQILQKQINIGKDFLFTMLQLYPNTDPFYNQIEIEYNKRYTNFRDFFKANSKINSKNYLSFKVAKAYYQDSIPDWRQIEDKRREVYLRNYFVYFNPADEFYYNTNILPEKIDEWLNLHVPTIENQKIDEDYMANAAIVFLNKTKPCEKNFEYSLKRILIKLEKSHLSVAFLKVYDMFLNKDVSDCGQENDEFSWARSLASIYRNIGIGKKAPNFYILNGLNLYDIQSDYTLIVFWSSWCTHCVTALPEIKNVVNEFKIMNQENKSINTILVSLDKDSTSWQNYIKQNGFSSWLNVCDFKAWQGDVVKLYNVYATPTIFVLDKNKKIAFTPQTAAELKEVLK